MIKPTISICKTKGADQLRSNCRTRSKPYCWFSHDEAHTPFAFIKMPEKHSKDVDEV